MWMCIIVLHQFPDQIHQGGRSGPLIGVDAGVDPHGGAGVAASSTTDLGHNHWSIWKTNEIKVLAAVAIGIIHVEKTCWTFWVKSILTISSRSYVSIKAFCSLMPQVFRKLINTNNVIKIIFSIWAISYESLKNACSYIFIKFTLTYFQKTFQWLLCRTNADISLPDNGSKSESLRPGGNCPMTCCAHHTWPGEL